MKLMLSTMKQTDVIGSYDNDRLPLRMLYLHPAAKIEYLYSLNSWAVVSDMFRSADAQLAAVKAKRGAASPGFGGHNFGLSIDIDVAKTIKRSGCKDKRSLDLMMANAGWYCWRTDHKVDWESWHYNFLLPGLRPKAWPIGVNTTPYLQKTISYLYGKNFKLSAAEAQNALTKLSMYSGAVDGKFGKLSKQALEMFQLAYMPNYKTGLLDARSQRVLAYVSADTELV